MGNIVFKAKKIVEVSKAATWVADKGLLHLGAEKATVLQKGTDGVRLNIGPPPEKKDATLPEVEEIKILTPLEKGLDDGGAEIESMIYGGRYEFEVVKFKNGQLPPNPDVIKWAYEYETVDGQKVSEVFPGASGKRIALTIHAKEACGRKLIIKAFISKPENGGAYNGRVHYRFRWFKKCQLNEEINKRQSTPSLVNQNVTSLCGMACIFYLLAKNNFAGYKKLAEDLHQKGEATLNNYTITPNEKMFDVNPETDENYPAYRKYSTGQPINPPDLMPYVDWITMASVRSGDSFWGYSGKNGQDFSAINWPWLMTELAEKLLGYKEVSSTGIYNPIIAPVHTDAGIRKKIDALNEARKQGYEIMMMIDSDLIDDRFSWSLDYHWVVLESDITWDYEPGFFTAKKDEINFSVFTWGTKGQYLRKPITSTHFIHNYYGFIKVK